MPPKKTLKSRLIDEISPGFTERSDRSRKNRQKGVVFERDISKKLRVLWPDAKRLFGQAREGNECPDVGGTPFWLELGHGGSMSITKKLEQAIHDSATSPSQEYGGLHPVAIVKNDGLAEPVVAMPLSAFLALCSSPTPWALLNKGRRSALASAHGKSRTKARDTDPPPPRPVRSRSSDFVRRPVRPTGR